MGQRARRFLWVPAEILATLRPGARTDNGPLSTRNFPLPLRPPSAYINPPPRAVKNSFSPLSTQPTLPFLPAEPSPPDPTASYLQCHVSTVKLPVVPGRKREARLKVRVTPSGVQYAGVCGEFRSWAHTVTVIALGFALLGWILYP